MKSKIAHFLCPGILVLLALAAKADPNDLLDPASTATPGTPQQQNAMPPGQSAPGANTTGEAAPVLPASSATPGKPEGLNGDGLSWTGRDHLTGNWGGFRDQLTNNGISLTPVWIGEVFGNAGGGINRGAIEDGLFNISLDLDFDRMTHGDVDGLTLHANMLYIYGTGLSEKYVEDFSNTSNIAFYNSVRLDELWIQKSFWEKRFSIKVGNQAVDNEFFLSSNSSLYINGTFGAFTLIGANLTNAPIYPLASPGVRVQFLPTSSFYVMAGVYGQDRDSDPTANNKHGTRFALSGDSGELVMTEAGYLLNQAPNERGLQGTYKIGSFVDTGNHTTFASQADEANGTGSLKSSGTNFGIYGVMDQTLYDKSGKTIGMFVRSGGAPSSTNFVDYYVDAGCNCTGFIPGRESDVGGLAVARSHVSHDFSDAQVAQGGPRSSAETVIEATYKMQIYPWLSVQPDLQYIFTPSGVEGSKNAIVLGLRSSVAF